MILYKSDGTAEIGRKKCNCKNHTGPHWIYLDEQWKQNNKSLKGINRTIAEIKRLKRLETTMQDLGILEVWRGI